jgi:alkaline phosphatase
MRFKTIMRMSCFVLAMVLVLATYFPVKAAQPAKYVFFFIGDGMATAHRVAAEAFLKSQGGEALIMNQFKAHGVTTTYANDRFITGSAAAATALACGVKTNIGFIGLDPDLSPVESMAEKAKKKGMRVGIVSSVSIDHATPAGFYAHQPSRNMYHEIAMDLANSNFDYFGGGGFRDPEGKKSKKPLGNALEVAKQNGYKIVNDKAEFMALKEGVGKVIAYNNRLPDGMALPYAIDTEPADIPLVEFTQKGIELLEGPEGFFMMVEGGKIDWGCHANDAATAIKDTIAFDEAIKAGYKF